MKLKNSVQALTTIFDKYVEDKGIDSVRARYKKIPYIVSQDNAFVWLMWFTLPKQVRQEVIELSIPRSDWVGGYPDYTDAHLTTLLKKAFNLDRIKNI